MSDGYNEKNARLEMTLKAKSGYKAGVGCDVSPAQWEAIKAITDDLVCPQDVLALIASCK